MENAENDMSDLFPSLHGWGYSGEMVTVVSGVMLILRVGHGGGQSR
jgi:hypothetical protein